MSWSLPRKFVPGHVRSTSTDRIRQLASIYEEVQKKTFTKWLNSQLRDTEHTVEALEVDLRDGHILLTLLHTLTHKPIPSIERGSMRIHRMMNVNKALRFLEEQLGEPLMNVGAEDIVDGNLKLTLGLIWVVILRFQIQRAAKENASKASCSVDTNTSDTPAEHATLTTNDEMSKQSRSSSPQPGNVTHTVNQHDIKASLLAWVRSQVAHYTNAPPVNDFHCSWKDGRLFMVLIHKHDPAIVPDIDEVLERDGSEYWYDTLSRAFELAQNHLDITPLLDAEDVATMEVPDERSIMIYVSEFYIKMTALQEKEVLERRLIEDRRRAESFRAAQAHTARLVEEERARQQREATMREHCEKRDILRHNRDRLRTVPVMTSVQSQEASGSMANIKDGQHEFYAALMSRKVHKRPALDIQHGTEFQKVHQTESNIISPSTRLSLALSSPGFEMPSIISETPENGMMSDTMQIMSSPQESPGFDIISFYERSDSTIVESDGESQVLPENEILGENMDDDTLAEEASGSTRMRYSPVIAEQTSEKMAASQLTEDEQSCTVVHKVGQFAKIASTKDMVCDEAQQINMLDVSKTGADIAAQAQIQIAPTLNSTIIVNRVELMEESPVPDHKLLEQHVETESTTTNRKAPVNLTLDTAKANTHKGNILTSPALRSISRPNTPAKIQLPPPTPARTSDEQINHEQALKLFGKAEDIYYRFMETCSKVLDKLPEPRSIDTFTTLQNMQQFVDQSKEVSELVAALMEAKHLDELHNIQNEIAKSCHNCELLLNCEMLEESVSVLLERLSEEEQLCQQLAIEIHGLIHIAEAVRGIGERLQQAENDLDDMLLNNQVPNPTRADLVKAAVADVIGMLQQQTPETCPPVVANELIKARQLANHVTARLEAYDRYFIGDSQLNRVESQIDAVKEKMTTINQFVPEALNIVIDEIEEELDRIDNDLKNMDFEANEDATKDITNLLVVRKMELTERLADARSEFAQFKEYAYRVKRISFVVDECRRFVFNCSNQYQKHTAEREKRLLSLLLDEHGDIVSALPTDITPAWPKERIHATLEEIKQGYEKLCDLCTNYLETHDEIAAALREAKKAYDDVNGAVELSRSLDEVLKRYGDTASFYANVMQRIDKARKALPTDVQSVHDKIQEPELMKIGAKLMSIMADDCAALRDNIDAYCASDFVLSTELSVLDRLRVQVNKNFTQLMSAWNTLKAELASLHESVELGRKRLDYSRQLAEIAAQVNQLHDAVLEAARDPISPIERLREVHATVDELKMRLENLVSAMHQDLNTSEYDETVLSTQEALKQLDQTMLNKIREAELAMKFSEHMQASDVALNHLLSVADQCIMAAETTTTPKDIVMLAANLSAALEDADATIPNMLADAEQLVAMMPGRSAAEELARLENQWRETRSFAMMELEALRKKQSRKLSLSHVPTPPTGTTTTAHTRSRSSGSFIPTLTRPQSRIPRRKLSITPTPTSHYRTRKDERSGLKWVRPSVVQPSPNHYVPDANDKLDVQVANIVNDHPNPITITRGKDGRYQIGDTEPRTIYCRILNDRMVMVRVGGGWVELSRFLATHTSTRHKFVSMNNDPTSPVEQVCPIRLPRSPPPTQSSPSSPQSSIRSLHTESIGSRARTRKTSIGSETHVRMALYLEQSMHR